MNVRSVSVSRSLILLSLVLTLAACGGAKNQSKNTFFYNESDGLNTLDPAKIGARAPWQVGGQIFVGLIGLDSAMNPQPLVAKSWSVSEDGLTWTFNLRNDVKFADDACFAGGKGRLLTAQDVVYSFERICTPQTQSTGFWVFRGKVKGADEFFDAHQSNAPAATDHVTGFRALNDTTVVIELTKPFAPFLSMLSVPYCYIVPHEAVEKYGKDFFRHPVGAGPFKLAEWVEDQRIVLARNANYFEHDGSGTQLPYLDSISFSFMKDSKSEFMEFEQGNLDAIGVIDPVFADQVLAPGGQTLTEKYSSYHLHTAPAMSVEYYGFMLDSATPGGKGSPLATNKLLRQAINYAVDRESIAKYVLKGQVRAATGGPIPPGTPGFSGTQGYSFNREKAKQLLAQAGYPGGKGLPELTLQLGDNKRTASVAEAVQEQLKAIGVSVQLRQVAFPQHREMILAGKLPFWRTSWMADYPDAENFIALFYSQYMSPGGPNTTHFGSARVDSLYAQALDPHIAAEQRALLYGQAERIILDEAPWVILYYSIIQRLSQPWVSNFPVDPLDRLVLTRVKKQSKR